MANTDFLAHLNPSQRRSVEHYCGALLVVAGAGSGKTRALTYRIANLIRTHRVDPSHILAVTFTNKAAKEMRSRIELLFAQQQAEFKFGKAWGALDEYQQTQLRSHVYKTIIKDLWIGTFHGLFSKVLRFDIEKYQDEKGRTWNKSFSIFDDADCQGLVKQIVIKQLDLDDKKFEPRAVRYAISTAKNQGLSPDEYSREQNDYRGRVIADVYKHYQDALCANNALDFDDLLLVPVQLFRQNAQVLDYWHRKFRHILVDEYQDTNRTQYDLIQLLVTNGVDSKTFDAWEHRSIFVVGDADQSIYSFRAADFTILMNFQDDFGDSMPDDRTETMVKLEENYRSRENILAAANHLIQHNTQRIDKVLIATRGEGEPIFLYKADNEIDEAEFVVGQIRKLVRENPELNYGNFAALYRTNAQSRPIEDAFVRSQIPYTIVGGLKFYDRREVKDMIAYLRAIANPSDTVSLLRVINTPRRGVGQITIDNLQNAAHQLGVPLWEILNDDTSVKTVAGRSSKGVLTFAEIINKWRSEAETRPVVEIVTGIIEDTGYVHELQTQGTDEALERIQNIQELVNATIQFQEENETPTLEAYLGSAALSSDLDNLQEGKEAVSLMTLHASKGLEFPIVFLVGLEAGLFPSFRSLNDPMAVEEERRLCYVGITRAQEMLYLSHARERRLYGSREPAIRSQFIGELPPELLNTNLRGKSSAQMSTRTAAKEPKTVGNATNQTTGWRVGDRVIHRSFGVGQISHVFGTGNKQSVAIKFPNLGQKIIDPKIVGLQKIE
ncbi:DNA helicase PcrA [Chamaesiphon sp. OTE_8_metabat_110]|uniref:DNA helicase PcrA n=2 Tax=unclassified Chamaesiphon TaxID=2620921 RepID=UPI00286AB63D|nr:DNA helicase PcrA [Chamaesiphon sp. OTE_8_metabat_110]